MLDIFASIFGGLIGSFLNALIYRIPIGMNIAFPRSSCPQCKKIIPWYENVPILSWLFLRGKCSDCKNKISIQYPIIEVITMIVAFLLAPKDFSPVELMNFFFHFGVFCAFLVHFIVDLRHQILPDSVNLYLALLFLVFSYFSFNWVHWTLGGAIGLGFPLLVSWIFYQLKGEIGLGGGDIKLYGVLGIYLGPILIMQNIFLSCFLGAVIGIILMATKYIKRGAAIPFGPFIIAIATFQIFFPKSYLRLMSYIP